MKNEYHSPEKLIKSGNLLKKGKINKSWQKRWCILSKESKLFYHKSPTEKHSGFVDLNQCIIKQSECTEKEYIFEINTSNRIFLFSAETKSEMDDWMRKIYTHSKIQKENDLLERAEYIIRDQSLWKSNLEDEFLKLKHAFNPYIFNQLGNNNNSNSSMNNNQSTSRKNSNSSNSSIKNSITIIDDIDNSNNNNSNNNSDIILLEDEDEEDLELYNYIPSSLLSFNFHQNDLNSSSPHSLSYYNNQTTKQLYNNYSSISDHEYKHPLILINTNNNNNGINNNNSNNNNSINNMTNILNNSMNYNNIFNSLYNNNNICNNSNNNPTFSYTSSSVSTSSYSSMTSYSSSVSSNINSTSPQNTTTSNASPSSIRTRSQTTHGNTTILDDNNKDNILVNGDKAATSRRFSFLGLNKQINNNK